MVGIRSCFYIFVNGIEHIRVTMNKNLISLLTTDINKTPMTGSVNGLMSDTNKTPIIESGRVLTSDTKMAPNIVGDMYSMRNWTDYLLVAVTALLMVVSAVPMSAREHILFDDDWEFAFGNAADPAKDFGCGTEYFNYLTKAASIHNEGPYSLKFDKEKWGAEWTPVSLPHDWVVDLPFSADASHSHGYKRVGYKYPESSVGWYRKSFTLTPEDREKHLSLRFDGIFRDSRVWVNGFYLGNEPSGYTTRVYDISEYLNYDGSENIVAVRADATMEEGWFYEGAGIYRHVWLDKSDPLHVAPFGTFISSDVTPGTDNAVINVQCTVDNKSRKPADYILHHTVYSPDGREVAHATTSEQSLMPMDSRTSRSVITIPDPILWDIDNPAMYKVVTSVTSDGREVDTYTTAIGLRDIQFTADNGFILNGRNVKLKGVNMHQNHAGVGTGIPDALQVFRLRELKKLGVNAYRSSHNPMTPEMLDACDSLGILVIEENRLMGVNDEHSRQLRSMIERDRNHPSIILWSIGNEEWGIEWNEHGSRIAGTMRDFCHSMDPTRMVTVATSSGPNVVETVDVAGYNYIMQNPVDRHHAEYPERKCVGSEETSGCGTRGCYYPDHEHGRMVALNRGRDHNDSTFNVIERGWKFYDERPWTAGMFFWTGFDYRGEPHPMKFPATGSQFGILDYCGFPKDEAYYLKSWWTDEPVLHIFPHWNLSGHEGEPVSVWAYSNADEVELFVNGHSMGRKPMPHNGHLEWETVYQPGRLKAVGYRKGERVMTTYVETTDRPARIELETDREVLSADNRDVAVVTVRISDRKGRFVPDANIPLQLTVKGPGRILGAGNGDPAYQAAERPTERNARTFSVNSFNGMAQILLQSTADEGSVTLTVASPDIPSSDITVDTRHN